MNLIQSLQEASGHQLDSLKKVIQKDARVKQILQARVDIDDIENKKQFLDTLKFYVLNNRNVQHFVESRSDIKDLNLSILKKLRTIMPADLNQDKLDQLRQFVATLFREFSYIERSGISAATRKELVDWANGNGTYFDLPKWVQRELLSVPNIRPSRPVVVYRGLLFSGHTLKERTRYDGTLEVGKGLKFLRSIREGTRIVDLEWDRPSSWSSSKQVAMQFAKFKSASSNFAATMNWLQRGDQKIDGDLGFIVSYLARPEDILIDMSMLKTSAHLQHGDEREIILKPGSYLVRVSTKYTKDGEVDPVASSQLDEAVQQAVEAVQELAATWTVPDYSKVKVTGFNDFGLDRILSSGDASQVVALASKKLKDESIESLQTLLDFYNKNLKSLDSGKLESLLADKKIGKIVEWMTELNARMNMSIHSKDFITKDNPRGQVPRHALSAEQIRTAQTSYEAKAISDCIKGRVTDGMSGGTISRLSRIFLDKRQDDFNRKGGAAQREILVKIASAAFDAANLDKPDDEVALLTGFATLVRAAYRTGVIGSLISTLHDNLQSAASAA